MEYFTTTVFNLDGMVEKAFSDWDLKQQLLITSELETTVEAFNILSKHFKSSLNDILSTELQEALELEIVQSPMGRVYATWKYAGQEWNLYRIIEPRGISWEIVNGAESIICFPDNLQKQLLIELGRAKKEQPKP